MAMLIVLRPPARVIVVHAEADEGIALGRNEPPALAVMLGAEEACGLESLALPPAEAVAVGRCSAAIGMMCSRRWRRPVPHRPPPLS